LKEATNGGEGIYVKHPNGMKLFTDMSIISYSFIALYFQLRYEKEKKAVKVQGQEGYEIN
jgi:hypothetical protein